MPAYVCLPNPPPSANAAYLGVAYNPFSPGSDPNSPGFQVRDLRLAPRVDLDRFQNRRELLQRPRHAAPRRGHRRAAAEGYDRFYRDAFEIVTGERLPQRLRHPPAKTRGSATATAATPGARARCWPAGWSRRASPSSP